MIEDYKIDNLLSGFRTSLEATLKDYDPIEEYEIIIQKLRSELEDCRADYARLHATMSNMEDDLERSRISLGNYSELNITREKVFSNMELENAALRKEVLFLEKRNQLDRDDHNRVIERIRDSVKKFKWYEGNKIKRLIKNYGKI